MAKGSERLTNISEPAILIQEGAIVITQLMRTKEQEGARSNGRRSGINEVRKEY